MDSYDLSAALQKEWQKAFMGQMSSGNCKPGQVPVIDCLIELGHDQPLIPVTGLRYDIRRNAVIIETDTE